MKSTLKVLGLLSVAAAGVASVLRARTTEQQINRPVAADHNVCRQLNQAMDRFEDRFGT
jgi:hypothetical protein